MSRKHLIHYHSSQTGTTALMGSEGLVLGEIAVQHNENAPKLYIKTGAAQAQANLAEFIDSVAINSLISNAISPINKDITTLKDLHASGTTTGTYKKVKEEVSIGINAINASNSGSTSGLSVTVSQSAATLNSVAVSITAGSVGPGDPNLVNGGIVYDITKALEDTDSALDTKIGKLQPLHQDKDASTKYTVWEEVQSGMTIIKGTASADYNTLGKIQTQIESIQSGATSAGSGITITDGVGITKIINVKIKNGEAHLGFDNGYLISKDVASDAQFNTEMGKISTIQNQLSGFSATTGAVKEYIDTNISSVYRYKGSVSTYENLPTTGRVQGDVYNVEQAHTTEPKFDAGSNLAWVSTGATDPNLGYWDILGAFVDLTDIKNKINTVSAQTETNKSNISTLNTTLNTVSGVAYTAIQTIAITGTTGNGGTTQTVSTTKSGNKVTIDFSNFDFDCGEYGNN